MTAAAAAPVYIVRPYPVRIFEGRSRLAAYGLPVLITALIFAALGILILIVFKDETALALLSKIKDRLKAQMSSFPKTRHFPTLSGSNKMKSFESCPSCVGEVPAACRFERKARLRPASLHCKLGSERSERSSRRKHSEVFQRLDIPPNRYRHL